MSIFLQNFIKRSSMSHLLLIVTTVFSVIFSLRHQLPSIDSRFVRKFNFMHGSGTAIIVHSVYSFPSFPFNLRPYTGNVAIMDSDRSTGQTLQVRNLSVQSRLQRCSDGKFSTANGSAKWGKL